MNIDGSVKVRMENRVNDWLSCRTKGNKKKINKTVPDIDSVVSDSA